MIRASKTLSATALAFGLATASTSVASAHPHVFVEASVEIALNDKGEFSELRQVWRFDELFSSTLVLDFDENGDGKLDAEEINKITKIVKESIAEYDFYTALRAGKEVIEFYPPEELNAYMEGGQMIMLLSIEPAKPHVIKNAPLRFSASDTSYYVAFEMKEENIKIVGDKAKGCNTAVSHPDFDKLYAENEEILSEAFFNENGNIPLDLGDEFYSWAEISCS